jgi:hypothetical protein
MAFGWPSFLNEPPVGLIVALKLLK